MRFAAYAMLLGAVATQDLFLQEYHRQLEDAEVTNSIYAPATTQVVPVATEFPATKDAPISKDGENKKTKKSW